MQYKPHEYQRFATEFIEQKPVAAIFLDMGLGKTVSTLTAINSLLFDHFAVQNVLVIAPLRVARETWPDEISKWDHLSHLRFSVAVGSESERRAALSVKADITIINRENVQWLALQSGVPWKWDMVVVDELSSFKNHQTKRFRSLMKVRPKVKRIVGLTGTPSSNGLMDLWAEFRLLDMGRRLGRFIGQYRTNYFLPDQRSGQVVFSYKPQPDAERRIYDKISDITISMKSTDHLPMPELVSSANYVHLDKSEWKRYKKMRQDFVLTFQDGEITAANAAALSGKLCQMANGAIYTDDRGLHRIHDRKLDALEEFIEGANGKPLLVAYWFKHDWERISKRLKERHLSFSKLDTAESIRRWNRGDLPVAFIHPAAAGHGLNLQSGGNTLVWFGLTWSLELYQQTNARLWRQGQTSQTVIISHILAKGTIDEQIMTALTRKEQSQAALLDAVKATIAERSGEPC